MTSFSIRWAARLMITVVIVGAFVSGARADDSADPTTTATSASSRAAVDRATRDCVNRERRRLGFATLRFDSSLARAARLHARNMANGRTSFDHDDRFGREPQDRVEIFTARFVGVGENIAKGYRSAKAVCAGWRRSPGHYANWVDRSYNAIGTGSAGRFHVQVFGIEQEDE